MSPVLPGGTLGASFYVPDDQQPYAYNDYTAGDEGPDSLQFAVSDGAPCGTTPPPPPCYSNVQAITITDDPITYEPYPSASGPVEGDGGSSVALGVVLDPDPQASADDFGFPH